MTDRDMKSFSFADAYGLGLIAKSPTSDWKEILDNLSSDAKQLAREIIQPGSESREIQTAAQELLRIANEVRTYQA